MLGSIEAIPDTIVTIMLNISLFSMIESGVMDILYSNLVSPSGNVIICPLNEP